MRCQLVNILSTHTHMPHCMLSRKPRGLTSPIVFCSPQSYHPFRLIQLHIDTQAVGPKIIILARNPRPPFSQVLAALARHFEWLSSIRRLCRNMRQWGYDGIFDSERLGKILRWTRWIGCLLSRYLITLLNYIIKFVGSLHCINVGLTLTYSTKYMLQSLE